MSNQEMTNGEADAVRVGSTSPIPTYTTTGNNQQSEDQNWSPMSCESIQDFALCIESWAKARESGHVPRPLGAREIAHLDGKCYGKGNGLQPIFAMVGISDVKTLEGRLLTLVDASFPDREQRKAFKDLVRRAIWWDWIPGLDTDSEHCGIPDRT